ncbi:hypothetical protein F2Q68_00031270 [Brassica cretica]|uniref:Uncharacterized protein n=1 Tax=Brassica cretica TaxID=69181 RepID=A0A8S9G7Y4_BRACR|nr:hypothetical protein F2Q68_00031270 [Brassica cretica]
MKAIVFSDFKSCRLRFQASPSLVYLSHLSRVSFDYGFCLSLMNSARVPGTTAVPPPMPPGATGPASNHAASSSRSNSYPQMTLNAMLNSPARLAQPHLHPDKINGALWFGIDPCANSFIRATLQAYYMGPWKSWRKVPDERRESWWQTKITIGSLSLMTWSTVFGRKKHGTIGERISKKKRQHKKPKYINDADWTLLLEHWATDAAKKKSKKAAKSRKSDHVGKVCHKHNAGPRSFARIEYNMMVASGTNERPSFTDLVRATHTRPDGTFVDYRAEELLYLEVVLEHLRLRHSRDRSISACKLLFDSSEICGQEIPHETFWSRPGTR